MRSARAKILSCPALVPLQTRARTCESRELGRHRQRMDLIQVRGQPLYLVLETTSGSPALRPGGVCAVAGLYRTRKDAQAHVAHWGACLPLPPAVEKVLTRAGAL